MISRYTKLKAIIAKRMGKSSGDKLRPDESIYHRGTRDYSSEKGHGLYKNQGLTNYINHHLNDVLEDDKHRR